ncbi:MAG: YybH family protein, partial [Stellaceae bacterium]
RQTILGLAAGAILVAAAGPAPAQTNKSAAGASQIAANVKNTQDAYNRKDAAALAAFFTEDALYITPIGIVRGRAAIRKRYEAEFKAGWHDLRVHLDSDRIRGNTAWAVGEWSARGPTKHGPETPAHGYLSDVDVRVGHAWKTQVDTVVGAPRNQPPPASH